MDNITHILCIKLWSTELKIVITNVALENHIKDKICNNELLCNANDELIKIQWEIKKWNNQCKNMIIGDLVTNINRNVRDIIVYKHINQLIKQIETELKETNLMKKELEIIFTLLIPIVDNYVNKENYITRDTMFSTNFCQEKGLFSRIR